MITNRHVVDGLLRHKQDKGFPEEHMLVQFVYPIQSGLSGWQLSYSGIKTLSGIGHTKVDVDIGFVEFTRPPEPDFEQVQPLELGDLSSIEVGNPIYVYGYPYGTDMLTKEGRIYRFGPVLQQGYISAIAPYDVARGQQIRELLLDVRTAGGMSGSPVISPQDGAVIGIHYAGFEATTQFAIPLDQTKLDQWLELYDNTEPLPLPAD